MHFHYSNHVQGTVCFTDCNVDDCWWLADCAS